MFDYLRFPVSAAAEEDTRVKFLFIGISSDQSTCLLGAGAHWKNMAGEKKISFEALEPIIGQDKILRARNCPLGPF